MTNRTDVDIEFNTSPRVAEVQATSDEIIMQDLLDTLRNRETTFEGMTFKKLVNASGKEDLGGGVKVGITLAMQNLLLAFAGRTTPAQTGTVTGSPANPISGRQTMQDTNAFFETNLVQRGSLVINFTDQSIADVISVNSETELETKTLVEGIGNTYDTSDVYKIWNIVQVNATGGNLISVNEAQDIIDAILPTAFTQVILTSSSSATLAEQADIQYASFNGAVTVDLANQTGNAVSGTKFPAGTQRAPCNNFSDAKTIAVNRGFRDFRVIGDALIDTGLDYTDYAFYGQGRNLTTFTLAAAATFVNSSFFDATVTGTLDGDAHVEDCIVENLNFVSGVIQNCLLNQGTITLGGSEVAHFVNCASGVPGAATPIIDMGGSGQALTLRNYNGGIELKNKTGTDKVSIDLNSGQIILDSTFAVTAGDVILRGVGKLVDNSTGAAPINELVEGLTVQLIRKLMTNRMETNPSTGVLTIYDDDDSVLYTANIYEDVAASQLYRSQGLERRNKLT